MSLVLLLPAGLLALASLLLPLLIHLSRRPEHHVISFAAMRWLRPSEKPRRRLRFEDLPLMFARLALVALLALLLAKPLLMGEWRSAVHWVLLDSRIDSAQARAQASDPDARLRWLLPGFPAVESASVKPSDVPFSSLLREFDDDMASTDRLTVVVPNIVEGLDAQSLDLHHDVDWRIVPSSPPPSALMPEPRSRKVALRHAGGDSPALRYLRATVAAWKESEGSSWQIDDQRNDVSIAAGTQWLIWLDAPLPEAVKSWVSQGGRVLVVGDAPSAALPIWRNQDGKVIATEVRQGKGRIIQMLAQFSPQDLPALLDADFPERVKGLLEDSEPRSFSDYAENTRPHQSAGPNHALRTSLDPLLIALAAAMFLFERMLASRRRRSP